MTFLTASPFRSLFAFISHSLARLSKELAAHEWQAINGLFEFMALSRQKVCLLIPYLVLSPQFSFYYDFVSSLM